jgi:putative adhesin
MFSVAATLVIALAAGPADQGRQARPPETDQTVPVARGARLRIDNFAGEVIVRSWNQDSLRVQARHSARTKIVVSPGDTGVTVRASSSRGPAGSVDYEITAPAWMPIRIEGTYNYVTIEGAQNEISVNSVRGDIVIKGGSGSVTGKSIEGQVLVEGARGKINVSSVNEAIKITDSSGEITAETTNGDITLTGIQATMVDVGTVNGDIAYEGTTVDSGKYRFATHNGDITMTVPETANATFSVRTYNGEFASSLTALKGPPRSEVRSGKRITYTLGNGSAEVELESFGGGIRLRRAGAARSGRE